MAYSSSKHHIGLDGEGYIISQRNGKKYYQKKKAPTFVNKFGGGDSSYRDASFWQFFVQTNWRNGAKQLKFDDAGKFWKSSDVDTTQLEQLTLSKSLVSAGQLASGVNVETIASWRSQTQTLKNDANLQGYWRLENNYVDSGPNGYTLTPANTPTDVTGKFGNAKQFVKTSTQAAVIAHASAANLEITGSQTWSLWYKKTSGTDHAIMSKTNSTATVLRRLYTTATDKISWNVDGLSTPVVTSSNSIADGVFSHICAVYDSANSKLKIWVDGIKTEVSSSGTMTGTTAQFALARDGDYTNYANGVIDDAAVFNRALTDDEVQILFNNEIYTDGVTAGSSVAYGGTSAGKIYTWDDATTWTEVFDARRLTWFETGTDTSFIVGDDGGTEKAEAQGFQVAVAQTMKAVSVYLKKVDGTPGDITVTIETNSTDKPSGTLVNAAATGTITAFSDTSYAWYTVEFATNFSLAATTTYWIVLKTAAAANDTNYEWGGKTASGYSSGTNANSTNGGSTWSAGTSDAYFRLLGNSTSVNCSLVTKVGGTKKLLFGTGTPTGTTAGDARIYSFDGTNWALNKSFTGTAESVVNSLTEYQGDTKVYAGVGSTAKVYSTSDLSTYAVSKDIDVPDNPGYIYALKEYNSYLYAGGGSPEQIPAQFYNGFLNYFDLTTWRSLYPFDFTVIQSCEFYDAYLFLGTYHGQLYVYDTSTLNPLFNFKDQYEWDQSIWSMKYFDDKLYIGTYPQSGSGDTNAGIWVFERHGLYKAHTVSGVTGYRCFAVVNGDLLVGTAANGYVYKLSTTTYVTQGWYQSSYFDANLPSINKLYQSVQVKHDALATGQSIVVYYRFNEADSWTTLGTSNTVASTEKTLSFATATYSKKISLKVELNTTTTTASPKLTEVIMQYTLYPSRKWMWTMRLLAKKSIQLLDRTTESRTATVVRTDLEDLMSTQSLYTFVDVDGTSYNVLVYDADQNSWVVNTSDVNEDEVILTLIEA